MGLIGFGTLRGIRPKPIFLFIKNKKGLSDENQRTNY